VRASRPDRSGHLDRDGVGLYWEVHGSGSPTILLAPTWSVIPSAHWKFQVPHLARHRRVVTFDGRGNGRSDRPAGAEHYTIDTFADDCRAVLDATDTERAVVAGLSCGALWATRLAADHPDRVLGLFLIGPAAALAPGHPERQVHPFEGALDTADGWAKYNAEYWRQDYEDFLWFFAGRVVNEPHSTKAHEDFVEWGLGIPPERLIDSNDGIGRYSVDRLEQACAAIRCPVRVVHGDADAVRTHAQGAALAQRVGGQLVTIRGGGHNSGTRDPVFVNRELEEFMQEIEPRPRERTWVRAAQRPRKALYLSSPIGLGHAVRDVAIAAELRTHHPDLQIDWLAQHPVTTVLEARGERVHPASAWLANESAHVEDEAGEHDLHAFQALRDMDEILVNNFMVFHDVVTDEHYDLVIGDEAWDVDYFLHENPELKHYEFAWMTDFVGWLPFPDGGAREAVVAADYNAEMIEQRARYRRLRDKSIFVGDPDDIVPDTFGPGLPGIREWTEANFEFAGYVTGYDPSELADREGLRDELGYRPDERVLIVTVGGSGVGGDLLRRVVAGVPHVQRLVDDLRVEVVCGPRIDAATLPECPGVTYHAFVPDLYRHLAACDLAVVQGGLTTCMELTANRVPFVYVPLRHHFEQNFHVHHRLQRYRAGRRMDYDEAADPDGLAKVVADQIGSPVEYLPVARDGAARAAAMIAELVA
jgi:pimeloyl-ACP methyl ester carboxylesterase/predicted glycosyltransferase